MRVGLGYSTLEDPYSAGLEALREAISKSGEPSFIILFVTFNYDPYEVFRGVKEVAGCSRLIGATSECIIVEDMLIARGVSALAISGEEIRGVTFSQNEEPADDYELGKIAGESLLKSNLDRGLVITFFVNGLVDASRMLYGLYNTMGIRFRYIGGGCGRRPGTSYAYTFTEQGVNRGPLVAGLVDGIDVSTAIGHGFNSIKEPLIITKTARNRIVEIDGISAIESYVKRFNFVPNRDPLSQIVLHPLGFPNLSGEYIIRDPVRINKDGSIEFPTDIPKGAVGYVMEGKIDRLIKNTGIIAKKALEGLIDPRFAIVFDCISRHSLMKEKFMLELKAIKDVTAPDIPITGMLSWGEIGSYKSSPMYHNKTTVIMVAGRGEGNEETVGGIVKRKSHRILDAELSILHEIASFSFSGSEEKIAWEAIEKTIRLFGVKRSAILKKNRRGYKLLSAWGFREADEVLVCMNQESPDKIYFLLGKDGSYRVLYMETDEPVEERERRIYTIFAKRLEEIFSMVEAITERNRLESSLRKMALTDDLTKLYNRRGFFLLGEQYLELSKRLRRKSILLYIDVDNMKWINDNLGHSEGDRALMEVASILRKTSRKSDVLARIGGDEFALLGLETGSNSYNALIERIKEKIEYRNRRRSLPYRLSLSIGVAICDPNNPSSLKALLEEADKNMYEEKRRKKQEIKNQP